MKKPLLQKISDLCMNFIAVVAMAGLVLASGCAQAQQSNAVEMVDKEISTKEIAQIFGPAKGFDAKRTAQQLSQCAKWQEPVSTDTYANNWYRAATTIHASGLLTGAEHQKMLVLY